jgi:transglutaminase-like putative cysteine protease
LSEEERNLYTRSEKYIEANDPLIQKTAKRLKRNNILDTIDNINTFVRTNTRGSGYIHKDTGAAFTLKSKIADCDGYSDLFIALCRANKIPAKFISGYTVDKSDFPNHAWFEFFVKKLGWTRMDLIKGTYYWTDNFYVQLSQIRNDHILNYGHLYLMKPVNQAIFKIMITIR